VAEAEPNAVQTEVAAAPAVPSLATGAPATAPRTRATQTLALQRAAGNAATAALIARQGLGSVGAPVIQRDGEQPAPAPAPAAAPTPAPAPAGAPPAPADPAPAVKSREGILDNTHIKSFADAGSFLTDRAAKLEQERALILGDTTPCPASLFNVAAEGHTLAATCNAGGTGDIDEVTYDQVDAWYTKACAAMDEGENARALTAAGQWRDMRLKFQQAQKTADDTQAKLADKRAAAFAKNDQSMLGWLWQWGTTLLDTSMAIKPVIEGTTDMEYTLANIAHGLSAEGGPNVGKIDVGFKVAEASKFTKFVELADKINIVFSTMNAVMAAAQLVSSGKSQNEKAKSDISASVSLVSSVGTLIGASTGVGVMLSFYIGPMTDSCLEALGKLEDVAKSINRDMIEQGKYDMVNWAEEPGKPDGRALFDFMLAVRGASDADGVPLPVPKAVGDYFVDQKGDLGAGTSGGDKKDALPTTGWWLWEKVDQKKIAAWVFSHKQALWEMFYGSVVPDSKH
jgi:hypothetical protein